MEPGHSLERVRQWPFHENIIEVSYRRNPKGVPGFAALRAALVKCNHYLDIFLFDTFTSGDGEFLAFLSRLSFI